MRKLNERWYAAAPAAVFVAIVLVVLIGRTNEADDVPFTTGIAKMNKLEGPQLDSATDIFNARLEQYQSTSTDIRTMMYGMVVVSGISIFTTLTKPREFELPFLGLKAKTLWLRWGCAAVLMYLWLHFGYALHTAIVSRVFLLDLGNVIETSLSSEFAKEDPLRFAIEDGGIGDFFFYIYAHPEPHTRAPFNLFQSWAIVHLLYGGLLGVAHASILAGISAWLTETTNKVGGTVFLLIVSLLLVGSHYAFNEVLPIFWPIQICMCVIGAGVYFWLTSVALGQTTAKGDGRGSG